MHYAFCIYGCHLFELTTLKTVYTTAMETCRPSRLLQERKEELPRIVVSMGKAAAELVRGVGDRADTFFVAVPESYAERADFPAQATVHFGSHPELSESSFAAGEALLEFVASQRQPILFLISGGSSACVEWPLDRFSKEELIHTNHTLIRSGWDIEKINTLRKDYSAIKGGRLGALAPPGSLALILSDVPPGLPELVGSGPTFGPGTRVRNELLADNRTLLGAAAAFVEQLGYVCKVLGAEINDEVQTSAEFLLETTRSLPAGTIAVAGGEPTVRVSGSGRGGRCSEMALRFALLAHRRRLTGLSALFASSDGMDGNSGAAGVMVSTRKVVAATFPASEVAAALAASDSFRLAERVGEPIIIPPTGNNLRDLFLLSRT